MFSKRPGLDRLVLLLSAGCAERAPEGAHPLAARDGVLDVHHAESDRSGYSSQPWGHGAQVFPRSGLLREQNKITSGLLEFFGDKQP